MFSEKSKKALFLFLLILSGLPFVTTAIALTAGFGFSLVLGNPYQEKSSSWSKQLLQISVIGLGFGLSLGQIWTAGKAAVLYTIISITLTILLGRLLGNYFQISPNTSTLITFGTAICGGSAIAAMAPVIKADDHETAVAMTTVFTLNSVALLLFPFIGQLFNLTQRGFGLWAALAIHDTSSVVGSTALYGSIALAVGTTVKLTRAVWIIPFVLGTAWLKKAEGSPKFPWFILGFLGAASLRSVLPQFAPVWTTLSLVAKQSLVITLFLIGSGLTRDVLKNVGLRPLAQGITLWILVSTLSLIAILNGWIV
jgi:uncharacterized integral membrane protein (TIGR00698 family)